MSRPRRIGVSYGRFSDPKQGKGDSEDRQERMYRDFCQRHNLTPLTEVFLDRGRSGYKDEHRKKGRLGVLISYAKDDRFEPGTVIVIEAWDRLGRLRPDKQTDLVRELLETGVDIGVCQLNDVFTLEDFGTHKWIVLSTFIMLAFQESKQKAERVAASWEKRRERAREGEGGLLGNSPPAWVEVVNGELRLIPQRAAAVRRIFGLAADGRGHTRIVAALTKEKVPPFGEAVVRSGRVRAQFSGRWTRPYVRLILNDRRAVGELQPMKDGKPDGPPLAGHLPAAVTEDEFLLARAGQEERDNRDSLGRKSGPRQGKYVNAFKGLLKHARDGEGWVLHNKGTGAAPELVLLNARGQEGRDRCYTFPYYAFEECVLKLLREVDPRDVLPKDRGEAPGRADVLRAKLANIRKDLAGLKASLKASYSKTLDAVLREKEAEEELIAGQLQDELAKSAKPAERAWREVPGLIDLIRDADDPEAVRLKLRSVLRRVVESVWVLIVPRGSYRICCVQVYFVGGARRDYCILHQTAGYRRKGGLWARSLADVVRPGALDLRKPGHAKRLEAALLEIEPSAVGV